MQGSYLRFYVHEGQRHQRRLVWEWLLEQANGLGIRGGSAFRAMAGFGRHHVLHESTFFELAGSLTVEVEFIVTAAGGAAAPRAGADGGYPAVLRQRAGAFRRAQSRQRGSGAGLATAGGYLRSMVCSGTAAEAARRGRSGSIAVSGRHSASPARQRTVSS